MKVDSLGFVVTHRCNLECAHCCADCGPHRENVSLPPRYMTFLIDELRSCGPVLVVAFTGGEPTLFPGAVLPVIRHCRQHGIWTRMVTNASWATTDSAAAKMVRAYADAGLSEFAFSYSPYHRAFVPIGRYLRAARTALDHDVAVQFLVSAGSEATARAESAALRAELAAAVPSAASRIFFSCAALVPAGRGAALAPSVFRQVPLGEVRKSGCGRILNPMTATVAGDLMACCGFPCHGCEDLRIGPLPAQRGRLAEQIRSARRNLVLRWIHATGPWDVLQTVNPERYTGDTRVAAGDICQGCNLLFSDRENRARLYAYVEARGQDLLFRECLTAFAPRAAAPPGEPA